MPDPNPTVKTITQRKPLPSSQEGVFNVFVRIFCTCGSLMELTDSGITYCSNAQCPDRAKAYRVSVKFDPLEAES